MRDERKIKKLGGKEAREEDIFGMAGKTEGKRMRALHNTKTISLCVKGCIPKSVQS